MSYWVQFALLCWYMVGLQFYCFQAKGQQIADIKPSWTRHIAIILTFPWWVSVTLIIWAVSVVCSILSATKDSCATLKNSWNGIRKEDK